MTITLGPDLQAAVDVLARSQGVSPETVVVNLLRERFQITNATIEPQDEWERRLLRIAMPCGVSLPNSAVSSDGLYD